MSHISRVYIFIAVLLIAAIACAVPGTAVPNEGSISTAAAQTVIAGLTQSAPQETLPPTLELEMTATPTFTFTPEIPTLTPTQTQTPLPIFTPTSAVATISVSVPTNCRVGPGKVYDRVGALLVGQIAEVYGRDPTGNYWYIRNPGGGAQFCWVWGEYATLAGPYLVLPVYTPPPTPTPTMTPTPSPDFTVEFAGLDSCSGWWVDLKLKNTGPLAFRSVKIEVKDTVTDVEAAALTDGFTDVDGCLKTTTKDVLNAGDTFNVSSPVFAYNPSGNKLRVDVTLCTNPSQQGSCIKKRINFTP